MPFGLIAATSPWRRPHDFWPAKQKPRRCETSGLGAIATAASTPATGVALPKGTSVQVTVTNVTGVPANCAIQINLEASTN
jgi:hypothetical protein